MQLRPLWLLVFAAGLLAGCARPEWLKSAPQAPRYDEVIDVREAARANVCNTVAGESEVRLLADLAALRAWAASRGVELQSVSGKELPDTPYAVTEYGQRPNSGYGLAISRRAGLDDGVLVLSATFFEPSTDRWAAAEPSSPCVVVSLPTLEYTSARLLDQTGTVRATSEKPAP